MAARSRADAAWLEEQAERHGHDFVAEYMAEPEPVPLGIPPLDEALGGGIRMGGFTAVGGMAGTGKSALGVCALYHAAARGRWPLYISIEMDAHQVQTRLLSLHSTTAHGLVPFPFSRAHESLSSRIKSEFRERWDAMEPGERARHAASYERSVRRMGRPDPVLDAYRDAEARGILRRAMVCDDAATLGDVCTLVSERADHGVHDLVVVDYAQIVDVPGVADEYQRMTEVSRTLRECCKSSRCPMLLLSSLRNIGPKEAGDPSLTWFRGSGYIGYDAFAAVILASGGWATEQTMALDAHIVKNRNGRSGIRAELRFEPRFNGME